MLEDRETCKWDFPCACGEAIEFWKDPLSSGKWYQHGANPEHRRLFTIEELIQNDLLLLVRVGLGWKSVFEAVNGWLEEIHKREYEMARSSRSG